MDKDFRAPWAKPISYEEWRGFLAHDFHNPSREVAYGIINNFFRNDFYRRSVCEIGFGQCLDFINLFKPMCGYGLIYRGYDITPQFVKYAKKEHPGHNFEVGGFDNLPPSQYDITYTRHTLEHQHPHDYKLALYKLLQATRELCIITWFLPPQKQEHIFWSETDGFDNTGCWVNTYDQDKIFEIIEQAGFDREIIQSGTNQVYVLRRRP